MAKETIRVLLVEELESDYRTTRDLLAQAELFSIKLDWVSTYKKGLQKIKSGTYDLLIIGYHLGSHTGIEFLRELRQRNIALPVIVLTIEQSSRLDQEALREGAVGYLVKSEVTSSALERSIRYSLAQYLQLQKVRQERAQVLEDSQRHAILLENLTDVFFTVDSKWRFTYINKKAEEIARKPVTKLLGQVIWEQFPLLVGSRFYKKCYEVVESRKEIEFEEEDRKNKIWYLIKISPFSEGLSVFFSDITHYKQSEERALHQTLYDPLTNLPNRTLFQGRLTQALLNAKEHNRKLAVLFLDLDRFKIINDTLGHESGDMLVKQLAERLRQFEKGENMVARFGGDEFLIMINRVQSLEELIKEVEAIFQSLLESFTINGRDIHINTSLGIALYPEDGDTPQALIKNADTALHRAKEAGRNTYCLYQSSMHLGSAEHLTLENDLRRAITNQEFAVYYQPIAHIETGKVERCEALLRWHHPTLGVIFPNEFIPLAEETGVILSLSEWTLRTVCAQIKAWKEKGSSITSVAMNVSAREFSQPHFLRRIKNVVEKAALARGALEIEVTESIAMHNIELTIAKLHELKKLGIHIAIDDFGTGHSSLNYLKRLPLDRLKIDKSFTRNCVTDLRDQAIVSAIVSLGHSLGLEVCAEGIEDHKQAAFLASLGCESLQGFFFSKSLPPAQLENWVRQHSKHLPVTQLAG